MSKERHIKLGKRFGVRILQRNGMFEYYVYSNGKPFGPYIASGEETTFVKAKKEARTNAVRAVKRMRQTNDAGLKSLRRKGPSISRLR